MNKTILASSKIEHVNNCSKKKYSNPETALIDCVIAKDTPRKLDFLILVIETLQINATESLLLKANDIGLSDNYSSRVKLWKIRCSNPLRNTYTYASLSYEEIQSLVELISAMAEDLYPLIRQLLSSKESRTLNHERWTLFSKRLKSLIRERMNIQRSYVSNLLNEDDNNFFRELLVILSLSCGQGGKQRLKVSLFKQA
tara:strand:- start:190 stop:786 length:597 start_codon:yes stop_codon:yes gene_type:complete